MSDDEEVDNAEQLLNNGLDVTKLKYQPKKQEI